MKESDKNQQLPRLVTLGDEMLDVLRPTEWGEVTPDVSNLTAEPTVEAESPDTDDGYTVVSSVDASGTMSFAFIETIPDKDAPLELAVDTGDRNHSAKSVQDTVRFLLDNQ